MLFRSEEKPAEPVSAQPETPVQDTNLAASETAAAKAEEEQPKKTAEKTTSETAAVSEESAKTVTVDPNKAPEDMTVEELQQAILAKMANNGPVTDQMKKTVTDNIWHDSLVNWLKSFH